MIGSGEKSTADHTDLVRLLSLLFHYPFLVVSGRYGRLPLSVRCRLLVYGRLKRPLTIESTYIPGSEAEDL